MSELRTIRLGDELGERYGRAHRLAVSSAGEAVAALNALYPGFNNAIRQLDERGFVFRVAVADRDIEEQELLLVSTGDVLIMPEVKGAGGGSRLIGAALIVVGALTIAFGGSQLMAVGVGLMLTGAMMYLSPVPRFDQQQAEQQQGRPSYLFNGAVNSSAQGAPAPWGWGRHRVGGIVISAGISVEDI
ncbi:tail assembly protein [Chromobacterium violaceum]|uniref:tail assembly protein n=1 Tax=Chromobacterium violaceum TaxID=536 RepID=UPI001B31FFC0|nr:tail assembly protein [Chromobacterium violaceum]MBP4052008.1 tail assembly protein [Chromobacterium violaceum]